MALDATKWRVNTDKTIEYTGPNHTTAGVNYVTVLELHRWLQDLADDASSTGDDYMDITRDTPTEKAYDTIITLKNGYTLHAASNTYQYIYGGSIIQGSGGTEVIWDGIQVLAPPGMHLILVQNGAVLTGDFWNSIPNGDTLKGINRDAANGISHQFMVKVRDSGADIDGRRLIGLTRDWGKTYGEFKVNGTARGVNVMAFTGWTDDLNNTTSIGSLTASPFTTVALTTAGYVALDVNNDTTNEYYYGEWTRGSATINQFYERLKYLTRQGETATLYGLPGQLFRGITHEVGYSGLTGTFDEGYPVSWGSGGTAGTGQVLADNGSNKLWIQLLTGVPPSSGVTISQSSPDAASATYASITERSVSTPFVGISTGSALIGAYGLGITETDLSVSDKLFDLTNTQITPPNLVTFTVSGLVSGEDYVLVGPASGGVLDVDQFTLNGALTGAAVTSVVVNEAIPADTPTSGKLRIQRANGAYTLHPYSAYNAGTKTFTITSHDFSTNNASNGANTFIAYIDVLASGATATFQTNYSSVRDLFVRIRDGGATPIKTFETTAQLTATGGSVTAIRTTDA